MNIKLSTQEELNFKNNIAEISSISLECQYDVVNTTVSGDFLVTGEYRSHEVSLNKDNFEFKIPFTYEITDRVIPSSILVNVDDFTYDIIGDKLDINIEYEVTAEEEIEEEIFKEKEEFEKFLDEHEVEIVDFSNQDEEIEENREESEVLDEVLEENDNRNIEDAIINSVSPSEDTYISYQIYVVTDVDSLDSIAKKYNITVELIKEYNDVSDLTTGMKLVIPCTNE